MKTTFVRAIVLSLVSTGFAASAVAARTHSTHSAVITKGINNVPIPMCGPNDPTACGMD